MWWVIWAVLVLGAAVFFALLGLRLWRRSVRPLLDELGRAAQATGTLAEQVAELDRLHPRAPVHPDVFLTAEQREVLTERRLRIRERRAERKAERRARTFARWREIGQPF